MAALTPAERRARNGLLWLLVAEGRTLREVGKFLGVSGSHVGAVFQRVERRVQRALDGWRCRCGHGMGWHRHGFDPFLGRYGSPCTVPGCGCPAHVTPDLDAGCRDGTAEERAAFRAGAL